MGKWEGVNVVLKLGAWVGRHLRGRLDGRLIRWFRELLTQSPDAGRGRDAEGVIFNFGFFIFSRICGTRHRGCGTRSRALSCGFFAS